MKKVIFLIFLLLAAPAIAAAESQGPFVIDEKLAAYGERIAANRTVEYIAARVLVRLREELAGSSGQGPFVIRKDLEEYNKFLEEKR